MKIKSIIYLICTAAVMLMIFAFSAQPLSESAKVSDIIVKPVESRVETAIKASDAEFEDEKAEEAYFRKLYGDIQKIIRKSAHVIIFAALAMFTFLFLSSLELRDSRACLSTLVFCALYAAGDEFHQHFVGSRNSSPRDVGIDLIGVTGMLAVIFIIKKIKRLKTADRSK